MTVTALALSVAVLIVLLIVLPVAIDGWARRRASPARLVTLAMVSLAGWLLAPLALAVGVGQLLGHRATSSAQLLVLTAVVVVAAATVGRAGRAVYSAGRRCQTMASALDVAGQQRFGAVTVVPHNTPSAFTAGNRIVISTSLLDALDPGEIDAVLAHEQAHLRGGHARIAAWAHAMRLGALNIPPARRAEARVREQLELLADRCAAQTLDDAAAVHAAISKLSALRPASSPGPGTAEFIDERLACLAVPPRPPGAADRLVVAGTAVVAVVAAGVICGALHVEVTWLGLGTCALVGSALVGVLRPLRRRPTAPAPPPGSYRRIQYDGDRRRQA